MIDINLLRDDKGGNSKLVKDSETKRFRNPEIVDQVIQADKEWREANFKTEKLQEEINKINKAIGVKKKESKGQDKCEEDVAKKDELELQKPEFAKIAEDLEQKRDNLLIKIGNVLTDKVPIFENEDDNRTDKLQMNNTPNE